MDRGDMNLAQSMCDHEKDVQILTRSRDKAIRIKSKLNIAQQIVHRRQNSNPSSPFGTPSPTKPKRYFNSPDLCASPEEVKELFTATAMHAEMIDATREVDKQVHRVDLQSKIVSRKLAKLEKEHSDKLQSPSTIDMNDLHGMDRSASPALSTSSSSHSQFGEEELKHFSIAKSDIDSIFSELDQYITKTVKPFIDDEDERSTASQSIPGFETDAWMQLIAKKSNKIKMISDRVARNHMKVVFFGRTSNGKSTSINAILQDKILPAGLGHTTSCFIQVQKSETGESYVVKEDVMPEGQGDEAKKTPRRMDVNSLHDLANALGSDHLQSDALININWSPQKCPILKHDVKIVDSPGIDVTPDVDAWIQKYCMDADVFVLVANAESTIMQTEKQFFHRVASIVTKPNIFILNNRWDMASELDQETRRKVQNQHKERCVEFLVNELGVCSTEEAFERVFFVSSKEALAYRMHRHAQNNPKSEPTSPVSPIMLPQLPGAQDRLQAFCNFERVFSRCLSHHAVETRFSEPAKTVSNITGEFSANFGRLLELTNENHHIASSNLKELNRRYDSVEYEAKLLKESIQTQISRIVSFTQDFISSAMHDECQKVDNVVNTFQFYFNDADPDSIVKYKRHLYKFVREELRNNISQKCADSLKKQVLELQSKMKSGISNMDNIVDTGNPNMTSGGPPTVALAKFEDSFDEEVFDRELTIDAPSVGTDFQEDLTFRFSLGIGRLVGKLSGSKNENLQLIGTALTPIQDLSNVVGNTAVVNPTVTATKIFINGAPHITTAATVGYAAYRVVGWRMVALIGGSYVGFYAWERAMWNTRAKERTLKRQFANHAKTHIHRRKNDAAEECSQQLEQQLAKRQDLWEQSVDGAKKRILKDLDATQVQLSDIERVQQSAKVLKNKADWITQSIQNFANKYISRSGWMNANALYSSQMSMDQMSNMTEASGETLMSDTQTALDGSAV